MSLNYIEMLSRTVMNPGDHETWSASYAAVGQRIRTNAAWRSAFAAVVQSFEHMADPSEDKRQLEPGPHKLSEHIVARRGELCQFVGAIFEKSEHEWPDYAREAARAAAESQGLALPQDAVKGVPNAWLQEPHTLESIWATVVLIAGVLEDALPLQLTGDQWWDPKYPTRGAAWENCFRRVRRLMQREPAWRGVFALVAQASRKGELQAMQNCYTSTTIGSFMNRRRALWDLMYGTVFFGAEDSWPVYAQEAMKAVSTKMVEAPGESWKGIRCEWENKPLWIVTFKVVVLLIAGPLEHELPLCLAGG